MRFPGYVWVFAVSCAPLRSQGPLPSPATADVIMARVAANQDRDETERSHYVYVQHARVTSRKGKTVRCEEVTDSRVTPSGNESQQELLKLDGRLLGKHGYTTYTQLPATQRSPANGENEDEDLNIRIGGDGDVDRSLVESMRHNLTNNKSKDGIAAGLFPLTSKVQSDYTYKLLGREMRNGRDCYHLQFQPKDKDDYGWKGDAYIDAEAFQPVTVRTTMSRNMPFAVRTLLGTSLPGLGFTVIYEPQGDGVWFPVSFGTEFKMHVLFFFNREILVNAENGSFEKTHVKSQIVGGGEVQDTPQPI